MHARDDVTQRQLHINCVQLKLRAKPDRRHSLRERACLSRFQHAALMRNRSRYQKKEFSVRSSSRDASTISSSTGGLLAVLAARG
jgi:hypothetical protein